MAAPSRNWMRSENTDRSHICEQLYVEVGHKAEDIHSQNEEAGGWREMLNSLKMQTRITVMCLFIQADDPRRQKVSSLIALSS